MATKKQAKIAIAVQAVETAPTFPPDAIGALVTMRFSSDDAPSKAAWVAEVESRGLPTDYIANETAHDVVFAGQVRGAQCVYHTPHGKRNLVCLPVSSTPTEIIASFAVGSKSDSATGAASQIGNIRFDKTSKVAIFEVLNTAETTREDREKFERVAQVVCDETARLGGKIDAYAQRRCVCGVLDKLRPLHLTTGTQFVMRDRVETAMNIRDVLQGAASSSAIYIVPVFDSGDTMRFAQDACRETLLTRLADIECRLDEEIAQARKGAGMIFELQAIAADAEIYESLLKINLSDISAKRAAAEEIVKEKIAEFEALATQARTAGTSRRDAAKVAPLPTLADGDTVKMVAVVTRADGTIDHVAVDQLAKNIVKKMTRVA